jgi:hypothetical protein
MTQATGPVVRDELGRLPWLPALVLLAGLHWAAHADDAAPARQRRTLDFRTPIENLAPVRLTGPEAAERVRTDAQGLRITLPAQRKDNREVGVELPLRIAGDFDISMGYELLELGEVKSTGGAGVQLRVYFDSPSQSLAAVTRLRKPPGQPDALPFEPVNAAGETFGAAKIHTAPDNKDHFDGIINVRAVETRGRLKLVRTGSQVQYLASDGGKPFKQFFTQDFGTDPVKSIRLFNYTGWQPVAADVRFTDLVIESGPTQELAVPAVAEPTASEAPAAPRKHSLLVIALVVSGGLALVGLLLFALTRKRAGTGAETPGRQGPRP